jgi:hypothetical protein
MPAERCSKLILTNKGIWELKCNILRGELISQGPKSSERH